MLRLMEWIQFIARGWWERRKREKEGIQRTRGRQEDRERGKESDRNYRVKQYTIHKAGGGESNRQIENLFLRAGVSNIYGSPDITVSLSHHKHWQRIFSNDYMATQVNVLVTLTLCNLMDL